MDDNGLIGGKKPIFNDVLAFVWNKMGVCPKDPLIKATKEFYKLDSITAARDELYRCVPSDKRRPLHRKSEDILAALYLEFQGLPTDHDLIFLALNLNNIPSVNLTNIDGATLVFKQNSLNVTMEGILEENKYFREELSTIKTLLRDVLGKKNLVPPVPSVGDLSVPVLVPNTEGSPENTLGDDVSNVGILGAASANYSSALRNSLGRGSVPLRDHAHSINTQSQRPNAAVPNLQQQQRQEDEEGFTTVNRNRRMRQRRENTVTGTKSGNVLGAIPKVKKCSIFISRLSPEASVSKVKDFVHQIVDNNSCVVEKLKTRFSTYSSFYVSCDDQFREKLLDPNTWEAGILVKPFYGQVTPASQSNDHV